MLRTIRNLIRLGQVTRSLARYRDIIPGTPSADGNGARDWKAGEAAGRKFARELTKLGPSFVKLGQVLATRSDMIGPDRAAGLASLHDRVPPFSPAEARKTLATSFGVNPSNLFHEFGAPVAAASIAQVHKAVIAEKGERRTVAVKILRPDVEETFRRDLESFYTGAVLLERFRPQLRRLKPVEVIRTLEQSVSAELDLRMEAAFASEMADNVRNDPDFRVPEIDWKRTSQRVMTSEWIEGIRLSDFQALRDAGHEPARFGRIVLESFLRHCLRDGLFHADMHPGNLFADDKGRLVAVDFGIMGRLDKPTRRFMAETLYGFITRDYDRVADVHFEAGYVPPTESRVQFAMELRTIGEPIWGAPAKDMSIARLLTQLFETTQRFNMELQPSLLLLQKTMVVTEGVARNLDPNLSIWHVAQPIIEEWMQGEIGAQARIREAADAAYSLGRLAARAPELVTEIERAAEVLQAVGGREGLRLHPDTVRAITIENRRNRRREIAFLAMIGGLVAGASLAAAMAFASLVP